ncbi:MAG TPA: hypothetical protein VFT29_08135 [Gemmatimonadaceae bacterium]|nr:hypothetical protein [Gemmatimonadaceae bacterium]
MDLLEANDVEVRPRLLGRVAFGPGSVAMQHLEQLLIHLGTKPVHQSWVDCIGELGVGRRLAGVLGTPRSWPRSADFVTSAQLGRGA